MNVAEFVDKDKYPLVNYFLCKHVNMQFRDIHGMLKLPLADKSIDAGCNFAAAAVLCNLIGGISRVLYTPKKPIETKRSKKFNCKSCGKSNNITIKNRDDSGELFKQLLNEYYPWAESENKNGKSTVLYELFRNPLVHTLGIDNKSKRIGKKEYKINKNERGLTEQQVEAIEKSESTKGIPTAITIGLSENAIDIRGLYRGVLHMLKNLTKDETQMQKAEASTLIKEIVERIKGHK